MSEENLYDSSIEEGGSFEGGFPAELIPELQEAGFENPQEDLGDEGLRGYAELRTTLGPDHFSQNLIAIKETLSLLPEEVQAKYKKKPQLLNSPAFLKDVAKVLQAHQVEKENREVMSKNSLKFGGMAEVQRISDLRAMQAQLSKILFQHDTAMAAEAAQEGRSW